MSKLAETVTNGGKISMLSKLVPLLFSKRWHFLFQQNHLFSLRSVVCKAVQEKGACWPPQELPMKMTPQLCLSWLRMRVPALRLHRGLPPLLEKPFLVLLPAERTDCRGQKGARYPRPAQQCQPLPWSVLAKDSGGVCPWISPLRIRPGRAPQWWTGPPAKPCSPPLQHTRPLSSTDANGLGSFLRHKGSHWPWKCFCLSFPFSCTQPHTSYFPDIMLPFVAVSSTIWGML